MPKPFEFPRSLIAVDLANIREDHDGTIGEALAAKLQIPADTRHFSAVVIINFMISLEKLLPQREILYFLDHMVNPTFPGEDSNLLDDLIDADINHPRKIFRMNKKHPKGDFALCHLHNEFGAVLITSDMLRDAKAKRSTDDRRKVTLKNLDNLIHFSLNKRSSREDPNFTFRNVGRDHTMAELVDTVRFQSENKQLRIQALRSIEKKLLDDIPKVKKVKEKVQEDFADDSGEHVGEDVTINDKIRTTWNPFEKIWDFVGSKLQDNDEPDTNRSGYIDPIMSPDDWDQLLDVAGLNDQPPIKVPPTQPYIEPIHLFAFAMGKRISLAGRKVSLIGRLRREDSNEVSIIWFGSTSPVYISGKTYEKLPTGFVRVIGYLKMQENQTWSIEQVESFEEVDDVKATSAKAEIPTTNFSPWGTPRRKNHTTATAEPIETGHTTATAEPIETGHTTTVVVPNVAGETQTGDAASKKKDKVQRTVVPNVTGQTQKSARDTLSKAGLATAIKNLSETAGDSQEFEVVAQKPVAGSRVRFGTAVVLTIRSIDRTELHKTTARPRLAASEALIFLALVAGALLALRMFVF